MAVLLVSVRPLIAPADRAATIAAVIGSILLLLMADLRITENCETSHCSISLFYFIVRAFGKDVFAKTSRVCEINVGEEEISLIERTWWRKQTPQKERALFS